MTTDDPIITIDEIEYNLSEFSEEARAQLNSLNFVESEIARANALIAVLSTAKNGYSNALQDMLPEK